MPGRAAAAADHGDTAWNSTAHVWICGMPVMRRSGCGVYASTTSPSSTTRPSATSARVTVTIHAPRGWRLLDPALPSNRPVPLRATAITVAFLGASGNVLATATGTTDAGGVATVDGGAAATGATQVRVTDADGNVAPPAAL